MSDDPEHKRSHGKEPDSARDGWHRLILAEDARSGEAEEASFGRSAEVWDWDIRRLKRSKSGRHASIRLGRRPKSQRAGC